jgi:hypothetical protein
LEQLARFARIYLNRQSQIANRKCNTKMSAFANGHGATAPKAFGAGGKGIRTPDFQLAKLALYQLSYAPTGTPNAFACSRLMSELPNFDCRISIARKKRKMPDVDLTIGIRHVCVSSNGRSCVRLPRTRRLFFFCQCPPTGAAKYAVKTPVVGSTALPVICPALFMSFALARIAE